MPPVLNKQGRIAHWRRTNNDACVDNVKFDNGRFACWYNDTTVVYLREDGGQNYLSLFDINTQVRTKVHDLGNDVKTLYGSQTGQWAAWEDGDTGLFTSFGTNKSEASLLGLGRSGDLAYREDSDASIGLRLLESTGVDTLLSPGPAKDVAVVANGQVIWQEDQTLWTHNFPPVTVLTGGVLYPKAVLIGKTWWIAYVNAGNVVLHPIDSVDGYRPITGPVNFDMTVLEGQPTTIRLAWSGLTDEWDVEFLDIDTATEARGSLGAGTEIPGVVPHIPDAGAMILTSTGSFGVVAAGEELVQLPLEVWPSFPVGGGRGRIVHPTLGAFDYEVKPDEWVNIDADAIIAPIWSSTRTLTSAANVLWNGHIRDVVVEERWKAIGGLAMPATQMRMLLAIWTTPMDPDVGYVYWYPNYITQLGFKVLPVSLTSGGSGVQFDDVINYLDENDEPIGWMTAPVTFTLKLVERL